MQLIAVRAEQQAAAALSLKNGAQLVPRDFKLRSGARVAKLVQARELQQNIQAADKRAGCGCFCVRRHASLGRPDGTRTGSATVTPLLSGSNAPAGELWPIHHWKIGPKP